MSEFKLDYITGVDVVKDDSKTPLEDLTEFEKSHNAENYPDPTCYKTIKKYEKEQNLEWERHHKVIGCILRVCELAGFSLENRIVLKDKKTGKIWE